MTNTIRNKMIAVEGGEIPITLSVTMDENDKSAYEVFFIDIDGVNWLDTDCATYAIILFEMLKDHFTEYIHYEKK